MGQGTAAQRSAQWYIAIAAAAPALIERVEPYWVIATSPLAGRYHLVGQSRPLGAEDEADPFRQSAGLQRDRAGQVVNADDDVLLFAHRRRERGDVRVMFDTQVAVGHHRATAVPATPADDVHAGHVERVGGPHHRADVEVVLPVLDGDPERMPCAVEVGDDRSRAASTDSDRHVAAVAGARAAPDPAASSSGHGSG